MGAMSRHTAGTLAKTTWIWIAVVILILIGIVGLIVLLPIAALGWIAIKFKNCWK